MKFTPAHAVIPVLALALAATLFAAPASDAAAGRELMKRYADAIVGVEMVVTVKMKSGDREQPPREQRIEVNGTVISPSGLTVTSLASVDPQASFEAMRAMQGGGRGLELVSTDFKEVKLRLADGKEVPARFVLKDADLDLAFMAPETDEPGREYPHVTLAKSADAVVLDRFFFVSRAPKTLQRVPLVQAVDIMGILEKPRRLFLLSFQQLAVPIFDATGGVLGITLQHFANGRPSGIVVLPAADIAEMAKQATTAQATPAKTGN
ncbi:MAG: serine protease [Opitutaceae bacterium]